MRYIRTILIAVSLMCLCAWTPVQAQSSRVELTLDQAEAEALSLFQSGKYEAAYEMYMRLLPERPDSDTINYGLARAAELSKNYTQALMAYERLLDKYPRDARLRQNLSRIYLLLGEQAAARRELDLAKQYDHSITDAEIEQAFDALQKQSSLLAYRGRISVGLMYDTNANTGPASNILTLGDWQNIYIPGAQSVSSWGNYINASVDASYRLGTDSAYWLVGDVAGHQRWNWNGDLISNRDLSWSRMAAGIRYLENDLLWDLRLKNEYLFQDPSQRINLYGPEATLAYALSPQVNLITRAAWEKREYQVDKLRNGHYWWIGQYARVLFNDSQELIAGVRYLKGVPDWENFAYDGWEYSLRAQIKLPAQFELSPFVSYRKDHYAGPATALEIEKRRDVIWRAGVFLTKDFSKTLQFETGWQYLDNRSNSALYRYRQNVFNAGITYRF